MRTLFIHQNFPGQFRHVAQALAAQPGDEVVALTRLGNTQALAGVKTIRYRPPGPAGDGMSRACSTLAHRFRTGEAVAGALVELRRRGFVPDVIIGHPGWGELMLVKEVFPSVPLIVHAEFYYTAEGADVGFDPEFPDVTDALRARLKAKNLPLLSALEDSAFAVSPTAWQASRFPTAYASRIATIHEGIRTDVVRPDPAARYDQELQGLAFHAGDEVITFVNRNLEPMRGFHILMRALPEILAARPEAHVVIVGGDGVSYGAAPPEGETWKGRFLSEVEARLPKGRVHFVGQIPYPAFISLMQVSRLHIYATYPFVLSWSMLEAMSAAALVLGSATPPVTEIVEHGKNGLLYDFFDGAGLARQAIEALANPADFMEVRRSARQTIVERYDLASVCLPAWLAAVKSQSGGRSEPEAVRDRQILRQSRNLC